MIFQRNSYFNRSLVKKYFDVTRSLSLDLRKSAKQKVIFENRFVYGKFFQDSFGKKLYGDNDSSKNSLKPAHAKDKEKIFFGNRNRTEKQAKARYPADADVSYRGEILFGIHPVYLALKQKKRQFFQLFLKNEFTMDEDYSKRDLKFEIEHMARELNINIKKVNSRHLNWLADDAVHQGVCLDTSAVPMLDCEETNFEFTGKQESFPLWVLLDSVQDPMNFGAVIRSAYFFGVDRLITVRSHSCKMTPTVSKASSGVLEIMDIFCINDLEDFVHRKKMDGWLIVSTAVCKYSSAEQSDSNCNIVELNQFSLRKPTILILGNEARGVSGKIQKLCDVMLSVSPTKDIFPAVDSLNVSVATGIILHHLKNLREPE